MALGLGLGIQAPRVSFDPAANNFFVRAGITDPTQKAAVNQLVLNLKAASLWTLISAIYPYVGGTAATHSFNLKSSSFTITWTGGVTHNANGVTGNGTTGFGDTGCKPSDLGIAGGLSAYVRAAPAGDNNCMGASNTVDAFYILVLNVTSAQRYGIYGSNLPAAQNAAVTTGMYSVNRVGATDLRLDLNGASIATNVVNSTAPALAQNFYVSACDDNGTATNFSEQNDALTAFHQGFTPTQSLAFYNAVQTFQTRLGRNV